MDMLEWLLDRLLGLTPTMAATLVGMYVLMIVVERFVPSEQGHTWAGRWRNFTYTLIYFGLGTLVLRLLRQYTPAFTPRIYEYQYPVLIALAYIAVSDFFYYWYHRLQHRWPFLWRIHELHHSDTEVNITTSLRTHWIERPVQYFVLGVPTFMILGVDLHAIFWWVMIAQVWEMFTHANVNCFVPRPAAVLCNPSIHRIHHSRLTEHHHCNFAQYLTLYDMIFGTYIPPNRTAIAPSGTSDVPSDYSVLMNIVRPFLLRRAAQPVAVPAEAPKGKRRKKGRSRKQVKSRHHG